VETRNVTFDQASGTARTSERATFKFPEGSGEAMGVEYNSQLGTMKLLRDVKMTLIQSGGGPPGTTVYVKNRVKHKRGRPAPYSIWLEIHFLKAL